MPGYKAIRFDLGEYYTYFRPIKYIYFYRTDNDYNSCCEIGAGVRGDSCERGWRVFLMWEVPAYLVVTTIRLRLFCPRNILAILGEQGHVTCLIS